MNYTVHFFDIADALTRRAAHSTLARAAQDARISVDYPDGPQRAEVYDSEGRLLWECVADYRRAVAS